MKTTAFILLGLLFLITFNLKAQNAPITTAGTKVSNGASTLVSITAINFSNIGSCNLKLTYNPAIMTATSITKGPGLGGQLSSNLTSPGVITLGWFTWPGVTLPNNSVIFNITFTKIANGTSTLVWVDDGYSCAYADGNSVYLNDLPTSSYYINGLVTFQVTNAPVSTASDVIAEPNTTVSVPIKITAFNNIGVFSLTMHYTSSVLTYQSFTNNSGFPGMAINGTIPGVITATGLVPVGGSGITLANNSTLLTLQFLFQGGSTELVWIDTGSSCEFADYPDYSPLYDSPTSAFYTNGSVSEGIKLGLKLYLEGPFQNTEMTTTLNEQNMIPLSQPYSGEPWNYNGFESVSDIPVNAVDWILIDLRESSGSAVSATSDKTIAKKAAFLMKDGTVRGTDGNQNLDFPIYIHHNLFVVVNHRNHLPAITSNALTLFNGICYYDFSSSEFQVLGDSDGHKEIAPGVWGMIAGDSNGNGNINEVDKLNYWDLNAGKWGYNSSDFSMNSQTDNKDKDDLWFDNLGYNSFVPQ